jgi:hypothetical protein
MSQEGKLSAGKPRTSTGRDATVIGIAAFLLAAIAYLAIVFGSTGNLKPARLNPFAGKGTVTYAVGIVGTKDSTCGASVTVTCGGACETMSFPYVESAWHHEVEMRPGDGIFINAQILCKGTLNVRVFKDGVIFRETSTVGEYVTASLEGEY